MFQGRKEKVEKSEKELLKNPKQTVIPEIPT